MPSAVTESVHDLCAEEIKRASAFKFEANRVAFLWRRTFVRNLLAGLQDCSPSAVTVVANAYGKPALAAGPYVFNTSVSGNALLIGIGRRAEIGEIGVDIEYSRPMPDAKNIATQFFSADENAQLEVLSGDDLQTAFFNCWTRKEAVVKAMGLGLSFDLHRFSVSMLPTEPVRIRQLDGQPCEWCLQALALSTHHAAAFATRAQPLEVRVTRL